LGRARAAGQNSNLSCELAKTTVHGYFDGELDAVRSAEFKRHLEDCVECQVELKDIESLRRQLQESNLYRHASPQFRDRVRKQLAQAAGAERVEAVSSQRWLLVPAFCVLAAAMAVLAVMFFVTQSHNQSTRITAELIDAHVRSLQPGHLTDVQSTDQHTVKPWFDGKLDFIPPVSDFSQEGFPLVGGRLDIIDEHSVAALVYSRRKHFINLFVWPYREQEPTFASSGSREGYNWMRWQSGDMQFCLVSDAAATDLRELKSRIRQ
jgi:anti-sigma factor RsiW